MSLKFFRRKTGDRESDELVDKDNPGTEEKKPSRRRGSRSRSSTAAKRSSKTTADKAASEETATTKSGNGRRTATSKASETDPADSAVAKKSTSRRRGRRGGAGRKSAAAKTAEAKANETATAKASANTEPGTLEDIMTQQQAMLQDLAAQQVSTLKGLQGSLSAIENRLAGVDRPTGLADRPRVGIFVDVPNIMYAAERERVKLDYRKVLEFLVGNRELVRASAYAPISDDPDEELETQKFVQPFVDLGYRIVTKPLKRYANGSIKANFDVELAIDVLTMSDRLDIVVLLSGDGDFRRLVELVESKGVRVEVVAFGQSTAAELRTVADEYFDLSDHIKELRVSR